MGSPVPAVASVVRQRIGMQVALKLTGLKPLFDQDICGVEAIHALEMAVVILRTLEVGEVGEGLELPEG